METNEREKEMETWAEFIAQFLNSGGRKYKTTEK